MMRHSLPIYLDAHAGMPLLPEAAAALREAADPDMGLYGNPQSTLYRQGQRAEQAVQRAQTRVAEMLGPGTRREEIVWTSCATESIRLALNLMVESCSAPDWTVPGRGDAWLPQIITFAAEHSATLVATEKMRQCGRAAVTILPCDSEGRYDPNQLGDTLRQKREAGQRFLCVTALWASNEVGTIQPVKDLARVCLEHEAILHLDSTQAVGWLETAPADLAGLGLMSFASHKIGGPSGAGALWVRSSGAGRLGHPSLRARDIQDEIRPGTLPVPAIMGFGAAAEVFRLRRAEFAATAARQVWDLWTQIRDGLDPAIRDRCILQGPGLADPGVDWSRASDKARLPNNLNFGVEGAAGQELYGHLSGRVACSPGSACRTRRGESSAVLRAMGIPAERAHATLRLGLSPGFPEEQITSAAEIIAAAIRRSVWC